VTNVRKIGLIMGSVVLAIGFAIESRSDILFRGRQPLKIGRGILTGTTIRWTDCSGKNPESFDVPPYSLDSTDNCAVGPPTFGLECEGVSCKVTDETKIQKYLPGLHNGDRVRLQISEHSVELQSAKGTVHMER
jgi:hypothetical protein